MIWRVPLGICIFLLCWAAQLPLLLLDRKAENDPPKANP